MRKFFKKYFYLVDAQAKRQIPLLIINFLFLAFLDVIGIGLMGTFLFFLTSSTTALQHVPSVKHLIQRYPQEHLIIYAGLLLVGALIFKTIMTLWIQKKITYFSQESYVRICARIMRSYQYAPYVYHLQKNSSYLLDIVSRSGSYIYAVLMPFLNFFSNLLIGFSILGFLLYERFIPTLFLCALFVTVGVIQDFIVKKKLTAAGKVIATLSGEGGKALHQGLGGIKEIRVLGRESYFLKRFVVCNEKKMDAQGVVSVLNFLPRYLVENGIAIFIVGLCIENIISGYNASSVLVTVGMFAVAGARLLPMMTSILSFLNNIRFSFPEVELIYNELEELKKIEKVSLIYEEESKRVRISPLPFLKEVFLENMTFVYPKAKLPAIQNVSMRIIRGKSIGIVGPSGAGKSTVASIILGLITPQQGRLLIDGTPLVDLRGWLNHLAYIQQSIFLLDDTLKRNIAMGIEDSGIEEARIWNAINMAQLQEVVEQLPQGIDTVIGENGVRLSGGQRQRVALARAFYHERDVIVMDEATSALDNETEKEVINAIKHLKGQQKTLIVIAHRLSTVEHCDVLYRFEKGRITDVGSYEQVVGTLIKT